MNKPYVICHMMTSIDGKVTGNFLFAPESSMASQAYYALNRDYKADGYACGRVTMQGSFCGTDFPELSGILPLNETESKNDYMADKLTGFYAVAFDPNGRLGWKSALIEDADKDPGYDGAQIIEVLTEQVDGRYLSYLHSLKIPYIFAGEREIDVRLALSKLKDFFGIERLLLEGGSIINGAFAEADAIDELSLVVTPLVAESDDKPLFMKSKASSFTLVDVKKIRRRSFVAEL